MESRRTRRIIGYYLAPCLLILVVLLQKYNVYVQDQLAERGGGFGMFSTVDTSPTRMVRFYLLTDQGEALVIDPRRTRVLGSFYVERLLIKPTEEYMKDAARKIALTPWHIYEAHDLEAVSSELPDDLRSYLDQGIIWQRRENQSSNPDSSTTLTKNNSYSSRLALPGSAGADSSSYILRGVRVELWTSTFNRKQSRLVAKKLKEVVIQA